MERVKVVVEIDSVPVNVCNSSIERGSESLWICEARWAGDLSGTFVLHMLFGFSGKCPLLGKIFCANQSFWDFDQDSTMWKRVSEAGAVLDLSSSEVTDDDCKEIGPALAVPFFLFSFSPFFF